MKEIGIVMLFVPLVVWFVWCMKECGFQFTMKSVGIGLFIAGWYILSYYFIGK